LPSDFARKTIATLATAVEMAVSGTPGAPGVLLC
jgi:hypothetical protein